VATWAQTSSALRAEYRRHAGEKLDAIAGIVAEIERMSDARELPELLRRFHGLSGSGFTYGFPEVSVLGRRGENVCRAVLESGSTPGVSDLSEWRTIVQGLRREFDGPPLPPSPPAAEGTRRRERSRCWS
jgi:hypothetical protein